MNTITYVKANERFVESYWKAVRSVSLEKKYLASTNGFPLEATLEFIRMIETNDFAQYYALSSSEVIGWCDIIPKYFEGMTHVGVLGIGLIPEFRHAKIGTELLNRTIDHSKQHNNIEKIEIEVFKSNSRAIHFFTKHNFIIEGERVKSRKIEDQYDNIILMGRFI